MAGTASLLISEADLRPGLVGKCFFSKSVMQLGAEPFRALKVSRQTLKIVLSLTGSQCSCFSKGVTWSLGLACSARWAAEF